MTGKNFFKLESTGETFVVTLKANCHGFRRGDVLACRTISGPLPATATVILERFDCGRWPMTYGETGPELAKGAILVGPALGLKRDLDREV